MGLRPPARTKDPFCRLVGASGTIPCAFRSSVLRLRKSRVRTRSNGYELAELFAMLRIFAWVYSFIPSKPC
jgi:hypothetical protein